MTKWLVVFSATLVMTSAAGAQTERLADTLPTGGINLGPYAYYQRGTPFIDYAKMAAEWISSDGVVYADNRPIPLTDTGYPAELLPDQVARTLMFTHNGRYYNTGRYQLSWEGTGEVGFATYGSVPQWVSGGPGYAEYDVLDTDDIGLIAEIRQTDPADPVRNIRFVEQRFADRTSPFHPDYIRDIENYGVLRFLLWNQTNFSPVQTWADRAHVNDAHWGTAYGIPLETQIQLANELQQDIWINVPHMANNDYMRQLGQLLQEQLDPNLKVWIEYTNEYWNSIFSQNSYVQNVLVPRYNSPSIIEAYSQRSGEVFDEFATSFPPERTIRVYGGWSDVPYALQTGLPTITDSTGQTNADVAAIAAYFYLSQDQLNALYNDYLADAVNLEQVFVDLHQAIDEAAVMWGINQQHAEAHGLPLVAYEAGQHIVTHVPEQQQNEGFLSLLYQIQRDPRMGDMHDYMFEKWHEIGGSTLTMFDNIDTWSRHGTWGLLDNMYETDSAKKAAVDRFLRDHPEWLDTRTGGWLGDVDLDGELDVDDIDRLARAIADAVTDPVLDLNRDGRVSLDDHQFWVVSLRQTSYGDTNLDGRVATNDLILAFQGGIYEDGVAGNATWGSGDWDGNLDFDTGDLVVLFQSQSFERSAASTPEPATNLLLMMGLSAAGVLARRSRLRCA